MTRPPYDAAVKARAMAWVARKTTPARVIAEELGVPRKTRYRWMEATRQHSDEPFVGQGHLRGEDQRLRDWERAVHGLEEEPAIPTKAMRRVANGPQSGSRSCTTPASPARSRRGARCCRYPASGMTPGRLGRPAPERSGVRTAGHAFARSMPRRPGARGAPRSRRFACGRASGSPGRPGRSSCARPGSEPA
jgi:transposase-like protein